MATTLPAGPTSVAKGRTHRKGFESPMPATLGHPHKLRSFDMAALLEP